MDCWTLEEEGDKILWHSGSHTPNTSSHPRRFLFVWFYLILVRNYLCLTHSVAHIFHLFQIFSISEELEVKVQLLASEGCMSYAGMMECESHEQYSDIYSNLLSELSTHKIIYTCDVCGNVFNHENELKHLLLHGQRSLFSHGMCNKVLE